MTLIIAEQDRDAGLAAKMFAASRVPIRHKQTSVDRRPCWFSKFNEIHEIAKSRTDFMLALLGPRGTGKTQAAVELIREACRSGRSARYATAMDIFQSIRCGYGKGGGEQEERALREFAQYDLLVIDEIQVRADTAWENNLLTALADERYSALRATVFVGNQKVAEFAAAVGDSITSRIMETGGVFVFDGDSFRKKGDKQ